MLLNIVGLFLVSPFSSFLFMGGSGCICLGRPEKGGINFCANIDKWGSQNLDILSVRHLCMPSCFFSFLNFLNQTAFFF